MPLAADSALSVRRYDLISLISFHQLLNLEARFHCEWAVA